MRQRQAFSGFLTMGIYLACSEPFFKTVATKRFPSLGKGKGKGFTNYANELFIAFIRLKMAAKPLPATSQAAAPLPMGGSFGGHFSFEHSMVFAG